jgi:hypothetical protein
MSEHTRLCATCGLEFIWRGGNSRYCKTSCRKSERTRISEIRVCQTCGKHFDGRRGNALFCKLACRPSFVAPANPVKRCESCGVEFRARKRDARFCSVICRPSYQAGVSVKRFERYGWTSAHYEMQFAAQRGGCAICLKTDQMLYIDHDHRSGKVRGLLCVNCNTALGRFQDSLESLKRAVEYLKQGLTSKTVANA